MLLPVGRCKPNITAWHLQTKNAQVGSRRDLPPGQISRGVRPPEPFTHVLFALSLRTRADLHTPQLRTSSGLSPSAWLTDPSRPPFPLPPHLSILFQQQEKKKRRRSTSKSFPLTLEKRSRHGGNGTASVTPRRDSRPPWKNDNLATTLGRGFFFLCACVK